jgi:hypothetical protein
MLKPNRKRFWLAAALLFVGISFLVFPTYSRYCDSKEANNYYCAAYSVAVALGHAVQKYNGAITAIATAIIGIFTATLYSISKNQLAHSHQVERAYISGGGVPETKLEGQFFGSSLRNGEIRQVPVLTGNFELHINNHGKTPGELMQIAIGFCDADNIPPEPIYDPQPFHDWIGPGTQSRPMDHRPIPTDRPATAVYGRLYYRDIFGGSHSSGFIQRGSAPLLAPAAYTAYD